MRKKDKLRTLKPQVTGSSSYLHTPKNFQPMEALSRDKVTSSKDNLALCRNNKIYSRDPKTQSREKKAQSRQKKGYCPGTRRRIITLEHVSPENNKQMQLETVLRKFDRNLDDIVRSKQVVDYGDKMKKAGLQLMGIYLDRVLRRKMRECWWADKKRKGDQ